MDLLLKWFGSDRYQADLERARRFWGGEGRFIVSVTTSKYEYRQTLDDEKMAALAPQQLEEQAKLPGLKIPSLSPDYGTICTAKYWGGRVRGGCLPPG